MMVEALRKRQQEQADQEQRQFERKLQGGISSGQAESIWLNVFGLLGLAVGLIVLREGYFFVRARQSRRDLDKAIAEDLAKLPKIEAAPPEHMKALQSMSEGRGDQYLTELALEGAALMVDIASAALKLPEPGDSICIDKACAERYMAMCGASMKTAQIYGFSDLSFAVNAGRDYIEQALTQQVFYRLAEYNIDPEMSRTYLDFPIRIAYEHRVHKGKSGRNVEYSEGYSLDISEQCIPYQKDRDLGKVFLHRAIKAAESTVPLLLQSLKPHSLRKSLNSIASFGNAPVFYACSNVGMKNTVGIVVDAVSTNREDYPALNAFMDEALRQNAVERERRKARKTAPTEDVDNQDC